MCEFLNRFKFTCECNCVAYKMWLEQEDFDGICS